MIVEYSKRKNPVKACKTFRFALAWLAACPLHRLVGRQPTLLCVLRSLLCAVEQFGNAVDERTRSSLGRWKWKRA
jgi:hypothetical protein